VVSESEGLAKATVRGFDLCTDIYNFIAFAVTSAGPGERSAINTYSPGKFSHTSMELECKPFSCNADSPPAPILAVTAIDSQSFNFTIFPPSEPSQCALSYNITPSRSDGHVLPDITIVNSGLTTAHIIASGYDVCSIMYSFTAVTVTSAGLGERSGIISSDFLSKYS
jgi:hypothetical protein